jgi:hypothetical protein
LEVALDFARDSNTTLRYVTLRCWDYPVLILRSAQKQLFADFEVITV